MSRFITGGYFNSRFVNWFLSGPRAQKTSGAFGNGMRRKDFFKRTARWEKNWEDGGLRFAPKPKNPTIYNG